MEIAALILLILFSIIGFILIFFSNFGTLIIVIGCITYALLTGMDRMSLPVLLMLVLLYMIGEIIEYFCIIIGAKKFGASNKAVIGAIVGGIIGAGLGSALFGIGLFMGALAGIFLGTFIVEIIQKKDIMQSAKAGAGSVIGRLGAIIAKVCVAIIMFGIVLYRLLFFQ